MLSKKKSNIVDDCILERSIISELGSTQPWWLSRKPKHAQHRADRVESATCPFLSPCPGLVCILVLIAVYKERGTNFWNKFVQPVILVLSSELLRVSYESSTTHMQWVMADTNKRHPRSTSGYCHYPWISSSYFFLWSPTSFFPNEPISSLDRALIWVII